MARNKGIAEFAVNFEPTGQTPLDAREQVETLTDLYTAFDDANNYYDKMIVTVKDEQKQYMLIDVEHRHEASGWKEIGSNGAIEDAPNDGKTYARSNGTWVDITDWVTWGEYK